MKNLSAMLLCDFYKVSHRNMYPKGTETVYSTWTPRDSRNKSISEVVVFGHQAFIKEYLVDFFKEHFFDRPKHKVVEEYTRIIKNTVGNPETTHIEELHDLGYLPLLIKALPEGTVVPMRTPTLTIQNTHPKFFWLTNYIETLISCELWSAYTSATIAREYKKILDKGAMKTVGNTDFTPFQGHDFSMRGMNGLHAAMKTGMGHLTSFVGTDTIPAIMSSEAYYGADVTKGMVGTSIPATEHSIQCAYGNDMEYLDKIITEVHPTGFVSVVSDGYDFWDVIDRVVPSLKDKIMSRDGRVVIRPDSGDPVKIICGDPESDVPLERKGAIEALWDVFGGTTTDKGYKVLDSHIGLIYGDAITMERATNILAILEEKGFASINVVFGIGSYTYQYNTRDTFGFAIKSTDCVINGTEKAIFKDPKTDSGIKKSQKGRVKVFMDGGVIKWSDGHSLSDEFSDDMLVPIYANGYLVNEVSFNQIRERLK